MKLMSSFLFKIFALSVFSVFLGGGVYCLSHYHKRFWGDTFVHVAHAGGGHFTSRYSNSIEALGDSYNLGFRVFELDLIATNEGTVVCGHLWNDYGDSDGVWFQDFLQKNRASKQSACTFAEAASWMVQNKGSVLIFDAKKDHMKIYEKISQEYFHLIDQFVPQVYQYSEISTVKELGYKYVIYSLYKEKKSPEKIKAIAQKIESCEEEDFGVAVNPLSKIWGGLLIKAVNECSLDVFVYTINNPNMRNFYKNEFSVKGIYTDTLMPH